MRILLAHCSYYLAILIRLQCTCVHADLNSVSVEYGIIELHPLSNK